MSEMAKQILGRDERFVEIQAWASPSVWTDQMLKTLHRGVKRDKYNKVYFTDLGFFSLEEAWKLEFQSLRSKH